MNFDPQSHTLYLTPQEADILHAQELEVPASDALGLYFEADQVITRMVERKAHLMQSGLNTARGELRSNQQVIDLLTDVKTVLTGVVRTQYPDFFEDKK